MIRLIFFGSFLDYSVQVLAALAANPNFSLEAVITTPPQPAGRTKQLKKTNVHLWAERHQLRVFAPAQLGASSLRQLGLKPDLFVTAGYGKLLPQAWLEYPRLGSLNLHFSLLPKYRGANPAEWAILLNEKETGVSVIEMSRQFDTGQVIAQAKLNIEDSDTRETLYTKLYQLGSQVLPFALLKYAQYRAGKPTGSLPPSIKTNMQNFSLTLPPIAQPATSPTPYAKRFTRADGLVDWSMIRALIQGRPATSRGLSPLLKSATDYLNLKATQLPEFTARASRALAGFPGLWTIIPTRKGDKRMKILSCSVNNHRLILEKVQIAGQQPAAWNQVKNTTTLTFITN